MIVLLVILGFSTLGSGFAKDGDGVWRPGRSTFYGTDGWSIFKGSCLFGEFGLEEPLGWDVAALSDVLLEYPDSCGSCIEVRCRKAVISDNYGETLDRTSACFDPSASIVVRVTDTCPCTYPPNQYSNKRWCCGDMWHMDLSQWAFEKLASKRWGVIPIEYRQVPCGSRPQKIAPPSPEITPYYGANSYFVPPTRDWPEYQQGSPAPLTIFDGGYKNGFYDASWSAEVLPILDKVKGLFGQPTVCAIISPNGAFAFKGPVGSFSSRISVHFWMYVGVAGTGGTSAQVADVNLNIRSSRGACTAASIYSVSPTEFTPTCTYCADYWWRWVFYLPGFSGGSPSTPINQATAFSGCGGNNIYDLDQLEFRNDGNIVKYMCISELNLY